MYEMIKSRILGLVKELNSAEDFRNVKEAILPLFDALKEDDGDE